MWRLGSGTDTPLIAAPAKVVLKQPVLVKDKAAPIPFHGNSLSGCHS